MWHVFCLRPVDPPISAFEPASTMLPSDCQCIFCPNFFSFVLYGMHFFLLCKVAQPRSLIRSIAVPTSVIIARSLSGRGCVHPRAISLWAAGCRPLPHTASGPVAAAFRQASGPTPCSRRRPAGPGTGRRCTLPTRPLPPLAFLPAVHRALSDHLTPMVCFVSAFICIPGRGTASD
jgi:hypothetical protein